MDDAPAGDVTADDAAAAVGVAAAADSGGSRDGSGRRATLITPTVAEVVRDGVLHLNSYAVLAVLGRGAYGEVLLGRDTRRRVVEGPDDGTIGDVADGGRLVALKAFSKSRLLKQRDMRTVGGVTVVTTALDKVFGEVAALRRLGAHPHVAGLREVLADPSSDDIYLGARLAARGMRWGGGSGAAVCG